MQEEFEKKLRERMHAFGIQPSRQVWDDINAALSKKKRRRFFIGWWLLPGLLAGIGLFLLVEKNNGKHTAATGIQKAVAPNTGAQKQAESTAPLDDSKTPAPTAEKNNNENDQKDTTTVTANAAKLPTAGINKTGTALKTGITTGEIRSKTYAQRGQLAENKSEKQQNNTGIPFAANPQASVAAQPKGPSEIQPGIATKEPLNATTAINSGNALQPAPQIKQKESQPAIQNGSTEKPNKKAVVNTIAKHPHRWLFTLSSGLLQTPNKGPFATPSYGYISNYYMPLQAVLPLSALAAFKTEINKPSAGWYVSAGGTYQYSLSNRWQLNAGLRIMYLTNTQKAGNYNAGQLTTPNSTFNILGSQAYYSPGTSSTINKSWQLQMPVSVSYVLNPHAKTRFSIDGGFSYAWQYSSLWLIPDAHYGRLYDNKSLLNNNIYSWQLGPSIQFHDELALALQFSRSVNPIAERSITPNLYWQRIGLQMSVPLKTIFRKK